MMAGSYAATGGFDLLPKLNIESPQSRKALFYADNGAETIPSGNGRAFGANALNRRL